MADADPNVAATAAAAGSPILVFTLPNLDGERQFDCSTIPAETRLDLLKGAVRGYIANRVNATQQRHQKDEDVIAWNAYDEAVKADALQTLVAKPVTERPAGPDLEKAYTAALEALKTGDIRKQTGDAKPRVRKDPLVSLVTDSVVRKVFESKHAEDTKYTYLQAKKEVGVDGIEYLNKLIEAKVATGVDRAGLEQMRDAQYINPAKLMLGITDTKAMKALPSLF